ncbi:hypothetical protein ACQEU3_38545 [Spirillospora sp. CA-253888]
MTETLDTATARFPDYPFTSHYFTRNGLRQHYLSEGTGEPVLLLHGTPPGATCGGG